MSILSHLVKRNLFFYHIDMVKPLLIIQGRRGIMACQYMDISTANQCGDSVALFSNVNGLKDMVNSEVWECFEQAIKNGIKKGMIGWDVLN